MNSLSFASIKELRSLLDNKKITAQELLDHCLKQFTTKDKEIGSALEIFNKESLKTERKNGLLSDIPGLIKDTITQKDRASIMRL